MFEILRKLMLAKELIMEEGHITVLGQHFVMQPPIIWITLQKELEKKNMEHLIYSVSKEASKTWLLGLKKHKHMSANDLLNWSMYTISFAGWGKARIVNYDKENKRMIVHTRDSIFAKAYGKSKIPTDYVIRGFLAGAGSVCFNDDLDCVETKCISSGSHVCEFIVKRAEKFEDSKLVKEQLPFLFQNKRKRR